MLRTTCGSSMRMRPPANIASKSKTVTKKVGLYSKQLQHCTAYLDHRDIGGKSVGEQVEQGPMFYSFVATDSAKWEHNREAMFEQLRLTAEGVQYRVSIISEQPLAGEIQYCSDYCKVCGKDFQADGIFLL